MARGARFDAGPAGLLRTREGGHHADRVIHAGGDATGAEIERALLAAAGLPGMLTGAQVLDVVLDAAGRAAGVTVLGEDGTVGVIRAGAVVLATGGAGHLYAASTNPDVATADGLAMALRAGAAVADLEFLQFHPTVLWTGAGVRGHRPLVTEAVRGEGAVLIDATGARIMPGVHVGAVDLSNLDHDAAVATLTTALAGYGQGNIVLKDGLVEQKVSYAQLGRHADVNALVDQAMTVGRVGNVVDRTIDEVRTAVRGLSLSPTVSYDSEAVTTAVTTFAFR
jgi:L-aspartate oxidase